MNNESNSGGIANALYSGASDFGRIVSMLTAIVVTILGSVAVVFGIIFVTKKSIYTQKISGTIKNTSCSPSITLDNKTYYNCNLTITYIVSGTEYTENITVNQTNVIYSVGSSIDIYYNPNNPRDIVISNFPFKWVGWGLILASTVIIGCAWLWYWITRHYKFAAAAYGAGEGIGIIKHFV